MRLLIFYLQNASDLFIIYENIYFDSLFTGGAGPGAWTGGADPKEGADPGLEAPA